MIRKALIVIAVAGCAPAGGAETPNGLRVEWTAGPADPMGGEPAVHLALSYRERGGHSSHSRAWPLRQLEGLGSAQLASEAGAPVRFTIARQAGRLDCEGLARRRRGTGECVFSPDASFASELQRRGIGRPTTAQQYQLAVQDVGLPLVEELARQDYPRPSVDQLVAMGIHGATVPFLRGLDSAGYRLGDLDDLVAFRIHGVTPRFIGELAAVAPAYGRLPARDLVALRIHGVTPELIRRYDSLGYRGLGQDDLVSMSIHGVTPEYIGQLAELGYRGLPVGQLVSMRIHGVTPDYVRALKAGGYPAPEAGQLVGMRISGFDPSPGGD
jgi:hypothetical protein